MSRTVVNASIEVYKPNNSSSTPDFTVPKEDIEAIQMRQRLQALKDTGKFKLSNEHGRYADAFGYGSNYGVAYGGSRPITTGDKIVVKTQLEGESSLSHRWTALAHPPTFKSGPGPRSLEFEASDFVWQILSDRIYFNSFENTPISGSSGAILETALTDKAPEIGQSQIQSVNESTDYFADGTDLFTLVEELAIQGDATVSNDGVDLVFRPISDILAKFELKRGRGGDIGTYEVSGSDDNLANWVRVNGGTQPSVGDSQTTQDSYTTVTESSRLTHQISTRKSEVDQIELWTRTTGSGEDLTIRLQKDSGGTPIAPNDRESDIARKTLSAEFLANGDYTTFLIPTHTLPEPSPWMIVESSGSTGQDVGTNSATGNPTYKAYFPFPVDVRTSNQQSINEYRRREARVKNEQLDTRTSAQKTAQSYLRHRSEPRQTLSADARSVRAHNLNPGEAVEVNFPRDRAKGTFLVTEVSDTYSADTNRLETTLEFQEAGSL